MSALHHKISDLQTEQQILFVKETFATALRKALHLHPVFAPLYVRTGTGINDDLNGIESPVSFQVPFTGADYTVVHSLAKWKRRRIKDLGIPAGEGVLTNMLALRPDEMLSDIHAVLVDQWDWERHMHPHERTLDFLKSTVETIYAQIRHTEQAVCAEFGFDPVLPEKITFLHTEDLYQRYPDLSPRMREDKAAAEFGAVFVIGIGGELPDDTTHDGRAPDYDDWSTPTAPGYKGLNGDIVLWHPVLGRAFEVSSMGIRVDAAALDRQLCLTGAAARRDLPFHKALLAGDLPQTIGGGIGQSRLAMFMLRKSHIAEVQCCDY